MKRFVVLDSWRGIAACLVALHHFESLIDINGYPPYGHLHVSLVRNAYLFVDLFFVLSGFVIAANYQQRVLDGFGVGRFLLLRLGRLYPLHFAMLAVAVALKLLLILTPAAASITPAAPFSTPQEAPHTILANLLLIHGLHVYDFFTWNSQSWSISTEFYTYVIFAACLVGLRKHGWIALLAAMIGGPVLIATLSEHNMDATYDWGMIRCLYGFAAGVISWNLYSRWNGKLRKWLSGDIAEWCAIGLVVAFVSVSGTTLLSVAAPYIFGLVVLVFSFEAGTASTLLRLRPLVFLGTVSYSIYMTHVFIARRLFDAGRVFDKLWHLDFMGTQPWQGDIAYLLYMAMVIAMSYFTYRWIERPPGSPAVSE